MGRKVKFRSVRPVGSGYQSTEYRNHEGYPDPTAGGALAGYQNVNRSSGRQRTRKKEKIIKRRIRPVSEMAMDLAAIGAVL